MLQDVVLHCGDVRCPHPVLCGGPHKTLPCKAAISHDILPEDVEINYCSVETTGNWSSTGSHSFTEAVMSNLGRILVLDTRGVPAQLRMNVGQDHQDV